ncbi:hypothetical protein CRE_31462 [Caenorhabditis remanei]|uniref:HMA domain-containing protein n=1 Tax=Caenorhabditis remanei TaxID=31234 RepID=E3NAD7_CAERE|nr:hypothetical protein CRE_31462 [Caenorhabditis remanei]
MSENVSLLDGSPLPPRLSNTLIPRPSPSKNNGNLLVDFSGGGFKQNMKETWLEIRGMTCHSCVNNIQDVIGAKPGISNIQVNLKEENGKVTYDSNVWTDEQIAEAVDDMGFECRVIRDRPCPITTTNNPPIMTNPKLKMRRAVVSIDGMTCHACVNNIQDTVGSKEGIQKIVVSLEQKQGIVDYNTEKWTGETVAEAIDDMGFECKLMTDQGEEWTSGRTDGQTHRQMFGHPDRQTNIQIMNRKHPEINTPSRPP